MGSGMHWRDKLASARLYAIRRWPWMRAAVFSLIPVPLENFPTFAVTKGGVLLAGIPAMKAWTVEEIGTVLMHEVCHVLRNHHDRWAAVKPIDELWGWAVDAEINDDLRAAKWSFPKNITPCFPEQYQLAEGLTAEEYYGALREKLEEKCTCKKGKKKDDKNQSGSGGGGGGKGKKKKKGKKGQQPGGGGGKDPKQQNQNQNAGGGGGDVGRDPNCPIHGDGSGYGICDKPNATGGWCGSGAGRAIPQEADLVPPDVKERTPVEQQIVQRQVAEAIRRAAQKGRGTVPGDWERWADFILTPPKINWRTKLARACRQYVARRLGAVDMSYNKPSRRQSGLGYGAGRAVLPSYFTPVPKVAVLVDTSGSMGTKELEEAVNESNGVLKAISADVLFAALDAKVQSFQKVRYPRDLVSLLKGGGGTDFRVGFQQIEEKLSMHERPKVIVFITDGQGPAPKFAPRGIDVIWVLVGEHKQIPYCEDTGKSITWGEHIKIERDGEDAET